MQFLAIVFTDVVASSHTKRDVSLGRDDRERDRAFLDHIQTPHFNLIRRCCAQHHGREVSNIGDAFYLTFEDPVEAVRCAVSIQKQLAENPILTPREPLRLRIGIHAGFPSPYEGSFHGTDVDAAARVEAVAAESQIVVSSRVHQFVNHMTDVPFHALGEFDLKGVGRISLWEADWDGAGPRPTQVAPLFKAARSPETPEVPLSAVAAPARLGFTSRRRWLLAGSIALVMAVGGVMVQSKYGFFHPRATPKPVAPDVAKSPPVEAAIPTVSVPVADSLPFYITLDDDVPEDSSGGLPVNFTVRDGLQAGDSVVMAKGAKVSGSIVVGKKLMGIWTKKINFRLMQADAVEGQKLNVRSTPSHAGKDPATRLFDTGTRQADTGKSSVSKKLAAAKGTEYVAYTDGEQTVWVRK